MASTHTRLMTFAEYQDTPDPPGGRYELRHGELVQAGYPKHPHKREPGAAGVRREAQRQLRRLLENAAGETGAVQEGMPYRPLPEYECWAAAAGCVSRERWERIEDWLTGVRRRHPGGPDLPLPPGLARRDRQA